MTRIRVFSKAGCGKCEAAKEKIKRLGFGYEEHNLHYHIQPHDNWRGNGDVELVAGIAFLDLEPKEALPTIEIDGVVYDYSRAMKKLKQIKRDNKV